MNMIINKEAATLERTSANEGVQLQSLTLSEGTIRFEPDVTDYNVTVAEDVTKILVKGVTSDENSFYTVSGNTNLVKGKNEIVVTVTDKDGNIGHYYIHVQVGEQKEQTSQSDSQSQTNQAAQSVSESVAKPGDENELLSNTVNEFKTFAETVTSGNLQYVTYGVLGCGALAVVLWIAVFIRRAAAKRRYKKERNERIYHYLELVGLNREHANRFVHEFSGGQRQRVAMGRAIVRNPKVFLMDEPLSNLDAKLRVQMRIEISKLHENLGATIIYVTHDQTEAMTLGTRIVVMKDGVVQQVDTPQALYNTPCNLFVAGFIGSPQMNFMDAKCTIKGNDVTLTVGKHVLKVPASKKQALIDGGYDGKTVVLGIRPEDVHDSQAFISNSPDSVIESTIKVYELLGAEVFLYFDVEGTQMTARVNPRTTLRTGDHAVFALDMEKIHLFDKDTELTITN